MTLLDQMTQLGLPARVASPPVEREIAQLVNAHNALTSEEIKIAEGISK